MSRDVPEIPEIPEKKSAFFRFFPTQRYSLFLQNIRKKFPGKSDFRGKFPKSENSGKFKFRIRKKSAKTILGKFNPRLQSAKHFGAKIEKSENLHV
jgi:hypothetical protein